MVASRDPGQALIPRKRLFLMGQDLQLGAHQLLGGRWWALKVGSVPVVHFWFLNSPWSLA